MRTSDGTHDGLSLVGLFGFLIMWSASTSTSADAVFVLGGLLLVVAAWSYPHAGDLTLHSHHLIALLIAVVTVSRFIIPGGLTALSWVRFTLPISLVAILVAWLLATRVSRVWPRMVLVLAIAALSGLLAFVRPPPPLDVYRIHIEAGRLIKEGQNPYSAMDLAQDLQRPEVRLSGYAYPPLTLIAYAVPSIVLDPRLVSTVWWVLLIGLLGRRLARDPHLFWLLIIAVTSPLVVPMLLATFTEPLVACLLVFGFELYRRQPSTGRALLLGLTLGSKQHVPTGLPGVWREVGESKGWAVVAGSALALGSGFLLSPFGYFRATMNNGLTAEPFPLAASLYGLSGGRINVSIWVAVTIALPVGWLVARRRRVPTVLPLIASTSIIIGLAANAVWSHWVLVMILATYHHAIRSEPSADEPSEAIT